jgi:DUF1365 family protein
MDNFIFNPTSKFTEETIQQETEAELFTVSGKEDFLDKENNPQLKTESETVFARRVLRKDGSIKYSIRLSNAGKLFNPISIYGQEQNHSFLNRVCRSNNKFKEVNQKTFNWYVKFLKTKNVAWLNNAERENE